MADTGAPWNLPYPLPTDLVRDGAQAIEDLAEATATGLSAAGGLVAVKQVLKTDTFVSGSIAAGGDVLVTGMTLTHEVADEDNRLIITVSVGLAGSNVGFGVHDGTSFIAIGNADGSRARTSFGPTLVGTTNAFFGTNGAMSFVHTPGSGSKTYELRAINVNSNSALLYVNRAENDANDAFRARSVSSLVIQEVKV